GRGRRARVAKEACGLMFNLKVYVVIALVAFGAGSVSGWKLTSKYYVAKANSAEVAKLRAEIKARDDAANLDAQQAIADREEIERLKEANRELQGSIKPGQCFDSDDTSGLRDFFNKSRANSTSPRRSKSMF